MSAQIPAIPTYFQHDSHRFDKAEQAVSVLHETGVLNFRESFFVSSYRTNFSMGRFSPVNKPSGFAHKTVFVCAECR
jgi:hypothetical protein